MYHLGIIQYLLEHRENLHLDTLLSTQPDYYQLSGEEAAITSTRWYEAFLCFFVEISNTHLTSDQMDDLLFFVKERENGGIKNINDKSEERILVRRRADSGSRLPMLRQPIDWGRTFLLNLIFQSTFFLVVSVCIRQGNGVNGSISANLVIRQQVGRRVFASQHEIHILERHNQLNTHPPCSYPTIYFGIDDLEDAFEGFSVERDQVMCVELLLLKKGVVHSVAKPGDCMNNASSDHVVLFQGAVTHGALQSACQSRRRKTLLYNNTNGPQHANTILMRGPHGKGLSQVAIDHTDRPGIMSAISSRVFGREANAHPAALKCRLVFVSLPWQGIIQDIMLDADSMRTAC